MNNDKKQTCIEIAHQNLFAVEDRTLRQLLEQDPTLEGQSPEPFNFLSGIGSPNLQQPGLPNNSAGAFIGLPKATNNGEIDNPANAPESTTYNVSFIDDNTISVTIEIFTGGWWSFKLVKS